ncbi:DNA-binding response OmpR family regulator [Bacillus pakistanensis]|uniref:DNA-binding response OmpR family regulator n=1 Tax=Rossellomorea pakistanensis TaxID=992288 RepID=A0ABS2N7V1_9BACI|nr:DNA-binding response OmpR family regulator [Bacillus pakistanensis]
MNTISVLIIDDDINIREIMKVYLIKEGYDVIEAGDGIEALSLLDKQKPDLLIIDIMMPYLDGFSFIKEAKKMSDIPSIFVSAKGDDEDKIRGLKLGSDDYLVKPFHPEELLARVEAVLRRTNKLKKENESVKIGPFSFNVTSRSVQLHGNPLKLTIKEYDLLYFLASRSGKVFTRGQLLDQIWGSDYDGSDRTVDTHIKTLRLKTGNDSDIIQTVWGYGYKFEVGS